MRRSFFMQAPKLRPTAPLMAMVVIALSWPTLVTTIELGRCWSSGNADCTEKGHAAGEAAVALAGAITLRMLPAAK